MADKTPPAGDRPKMHVGPDDWPETAADRIVEVVDKVRRQTTDRVILVVRAVVYMLVIAVAAVALIIMFAIVGVRLADAYLPIGGGVGSATWAAHGFIGLLLVVMGFGAWRSRAGSDRPIKIAASVNGAIVLAVVIYGIIDLVQ